MKQIPKSATPRTDEEAKCTPRNGVEVVEASFARDLEKEIVRLYMALNRIVICGGIGDEDMFDDARWLLDKYVLTDHSEDLEFIDEFGITGVLHKQSK